MSRHAGFCCHTSIHETHIHTQQFKRCRATMEQSTRQMNTHSTRQMTHACCKPKQAEIGNLRSIVNRLEGEKRASGAAEEASPRGWLPRSPSPLGHQEAVGVGVLGGGGRLPARAPEGAAARWNELSPVRGCLGRVEAWEYHAYELSVAVQGAASKRGLRGRFHSCFEHVRRFHWTVAASTHTCWTGMQSVLLHGSVV